jgi:hypothetical protein
VIRYLNIYPTFTSITVYESLEAARLACAYNPEVRTVKLVAVAPMAREELYDLYRKEYPIETQASEYGEVVEEEVKRALDFGYAQAWK